MSTPIRGYIEKYSGDPGAVPDLNFRRDGFTLHHAIPDKFSTQDALCVKAMELTAYSPDRMSNYHPMPMEKLFRQLDGQEVGHWSHHADYDELTVTPAVQRRQLVLEMKYGPLSTWNESHPRIAELKADLEISMKQIEAELIQKIKSGDVPMALDPTLNGDRGRIR